MTVQEKINWGVCSLLLMAIPASAQQVLTVAAFPAVDEIIRAAIPAWSLLHPNVEIKLVSRVLTDMVRDVFGGSRAAIVQELLGGAQASPEELDEVERLIASLRKQRGGDAK